MIMWLKRKKAALCILAGICAISVFIIIDSNRNLKENNGSFYVVKIKHYGIDAKEIERSITIPLEDSLFAIPGVYSILSSSENSLSNVYISFKNGNSKNYEAVRDAAQRVYESLPSSVQRPEILSSNNSRVPVWSSAVFEKDSNASFKETAQLLDKVLKPRFESFNGAGEVIVSGAGSKQIFIILDQEKLNLIGLEAMSVAASIGKNDSLFPAGSIIQNKKEILITVDGRQNLEQMLIPLDDGKFVELSDIAIIIERDKEPDILSRLNGKKAAGISIMGQDKTNLQKLSLDIKKELQKPEFENLEFVVLSDLGAEESRAFRSVLNAALSGAFMVALISFLLNAYSKYLNQRSDIAVRGLFCAITIPVICLITIAILIIFGFPADRLMLAGIAAGVGTAVDAVILSSEKIRRCKDYFSAAASIKNLARPLIAGAMTTVVALLPLVVMQDGNVSIIAFSIAVVCIVSLTISLFLLPPLLLWNLEKLQVPITKNNRQIYLWIVLKKKLTHSIFRLLAANIKFCSRYPLFVLTTGIILTLGAIFTIFNKGVDTASYGSEDSIYAQVEFDGGLLSEEVDRLLADYSVQLSGYPGIKNVETGARTGSGSLLISFDPKIISANSLRETAKQIPVQGGFVFFHESSSKERYWEIKIFGDDDKKCREIAEELASIIANHNLVKDRVLNFKQGSKKLILMPDRELFAEAEKAFSNAANSIRTGVYGPVIYKRKEPDGEIDVRILSNTLIESNISYAGIYQTREEALNLLISNTGSTVLHVDTLMRKQEEVEPSSIRREDRRRTASITITTDPIDPRRVKTELLSVFEDINLPPGYSIEFDPVAIKQAENLTATVLSFVMAIIFCYMIIAAINESFSVPLIVLSAIPFSLSIPALCLVLSGNAYNLAIGCAFIAVSGMTVNAAVLCVDELKLRIKDKEVKCTEIYKALRKKLSALLATSATTIAGAMPFLFLKEDANILIRTISQVGALGVTCSCICSITIIPSLFILFKYSAFKNVKQ